jgi:hypothetical protein
MKGGRGRSFSAIVRLPSRSLGSGGCGNLFKILLDASDKMLFSFSIKDRFEMHVHPEVEEEIKFITTAGYSNQDHEIFQSHALRICSGVQLQNKDNDAKNCGHNQFEDVKKSSFQFPTVLLTQRNQKAFRQ